MKKYIVLLFGLICFASCQNTIVKTCGGSMTIKLEKGQKLMEVTWKGDDVWYLTEPMDSDYVPKTKVFQEDSRFGVLEGKITFIESK